jgi:hypothetical protein
MTGRPGRLSVEQIEPELGKGGGAHDVHGAPLARRYSSAVLHPKQLDRMRCDAPR